MVFVSSRLPDTWGHNEERSLEAVQNLSRVCQQAVQDAHSPVVCWGGDANIAFDLLHGCQGVGACCETVELTERHWTFYDF